MRALRNLVFPSCFALTLAAALPAASAQADGGVWREAKEMPEVALTSCAAELARRGYEIREVTGGRQIDRYVDLRYQATRSDRTLTTICRYDSSREKVTAVRESKD